MATELSTPKRTKAPVQVADPETSSNTGLICGLIVLLSFLPIFLLHAQRLWALPHYQFFPLVLLGSFIIAWSRWQDAGPLVRGDALITFAGVAAAWSILAVAEVVLSSTLGVVAGLVLLAALIYGAGGWPFLRLQFPAWLFLWMAVPLPFGLDRKFVMSMQTVTSKWSSWVLDLLGIFHQLTGNVVEITGNRLLVEEACAGVNSLFSLMACSLFLVFFLRRPWIRAALLVIATLGWVLVCNVVRVTLIAVAADRWHQDLATGWRHEALGYACFFLAVCLIWSTDRFFLFLKPHWTDEAASSKGDSETTVAGVLTSLAGGLAWPAAIAFALLFVFHLTVHGSGLLEAFRTEEILPTIATLDSETLPKTTTAFKWTRDKDGFKESVRKPGSAYGEFSKTWCYKRDIVTAFVSLDYPFPGFHDLKGCYENAGWVVVKETPHPRNPKKPDEVFYLEVNLKQSYKHGYLLFAIADSKSKVLEPQPIGVTSTFARYEKAFASLKNRFTKGGSEPEPEESRGTSYQFQTYVESNAPFTDDELAATKQLFFETTRTLHQKIFPKTP